VNKQPGLLVRRLNAKALTYANHILFAPDQFNPTTKAGMHLLLHELVHYKQQILTKFPRIQRAEPDTNATLHSDVILVDVSPDINNRVNQEIVKANKNFPGSDSHVIVSEVAISLGQDSKESNYQLTKIESWAMTLRPNQIHKQKKDNTKYQGVDYKLWNLPKVPVLSPTIQVNGIYIGIDKLGHFFQQGFQYYEVEDQKKGQSQEFGKGTEVGFYGLASTGVYSQADLEANRQGLLFFKQISIWCLI
jgi:hypothetical protein